MLLSIGLWVADDVRGIDALRLVDDQTTLVHSHLLVLSHLSKMLVTLLLGVVVLSKLTKLLAALLLTRSRQLSRLSEIMGLVLWGTLKWLHLLLRLERSAVWDIDLVCVCVGV